MLVANLLSLSHVRLVGCLVRLKMIIIFGYSVSSLGCCFRAWTFCRLPMTDLWNPFILEIAKGSSIF